MLASLGENLQGIALWDADWQCYNNVYLLRRGARLILIDCGKASQGAALASELAQLDLCPTDWVQLPPDLQSLFSPALPEAADLAWRLLGFHTPGSVALFDQDSGALFIGDHICFPGVPLGPEGLVVSAREAQEQALQYACDWAGSAEARSRYNLELFRAGVAALAQFPARYLCTGHGVILAGDVPALLAPLLSQA